MSHVPATRRSAHGSGDGGRWAALAALVERHHSALIGYLSRLVGGARHLAEDLCQETFARLLRQQNYQAGCPFKPWLYAIATNLARDHLKSAATCRTLRQSEQVEMLLTLRDARPGPEDQALAAEHGREVVAALTKLSEEYRAALLLRFYHGFSLQEIAETPHVPLGTVKSRLSVGTRRLRDLLIPLWEGVEQR